MWLEAKNLTLPYISAKLAPKHHRPFRITKEISPVAYQLELPRAWTIHDIFHSLLLTPYKETQEHGAQFQHPPLELIDNEEEYEVGDIIDHRYHGKQCQLQYLIHWKGYSAADNTWEPTDQVHADQLVKKYHLKHELHETRHKSRQQINTRKPICPIPPCPLPTQQTSPPTPSSFTVDMDTAETLPVQPQVDTPMVHQQDPISIPVAIVATSHEFSELQLSPQLVCTALKGHSAPGREELLLIMQGLAGVVQKNQEVSCDYQKQLEVLCQ